MRGGRGSSAIRSGCRATEIEIARTTVYGRESSSTKGAENGRCDDGEHEQDDGIRCKHVEDSRHDNLPRSWCMNRYYGCHEPRASSEDEALVSVSGYELFIRRSTDARLMKFCDLVRRGWLLTCKKLRGISSSRDAEG